MGSAQSTERAMLKQPVQSTHQRTEEERDASIICHVHHALRHYNAHSEGCCFVPVKPLMAAYVGFGGHIWVHVSFLARRNKIISSKRRRSKDNDHVKYFFAELRYDHHFGAPTVETCVIIDGSSRHCHLNTMCAFCPKSFEIFHPFDGKFMCGKKSQANEGQGFMQFKNLLEQPYTCSTGSPTEIGEAKEDVATQKKKLSIMSWTLLPFNLIGRFLRVVMLS